ncbi:MAG: ABC transporter substrate-binding protein [bacterium]|nr:ABC transporter substrate-binding protein [bacterium]
MKNFKYILLLILVGLISLKSCKKNDENETTQETINIGLVVSMFLNPEYSQEMINGANLAIDEINASGGILGKGIKLFIADDKSDKELTVTKSQLLINEHNVVCIFTSSSSRSIHAAQNVTILNKIVHMSYNATSPELSSLDDDGFFWRTIPSDVYQGKVSAEYVYNVLGITNTCILSIDNIYGNGLSESFTENFTSLGGTVLFHTKYTEQPTYEDFDFKPMLDEVFSYSPQSFFCLNNGIESVKITNKINIENYFNQSFHPQMIGSDAHKSPTFIPDSPESVIDGMIGTSAAAGESTEFEDNYIESYGVSALAMETKNIYDAIYLIAYAILSAESSVPSDYVLKLREVSRVGEKIGINEFVEAKVLIERGIDIDYDGASGKIDFDENGDVTSGTYEIWKIEDGEFVTVTTVDFPK